MREGYRKVFESENPEGWTCRVCEESHDDEDSARECCDLVRYACAVCGMSHRDKDDAANCCEPVREGSGDTIWTYQCNWCHRKHIAEEPAEKCCPVRNYKCSSCGEKFTIEQFENKEICSCERSVHQVILF